ncbi:MAG: transcriptional repressor [Ruminococcaceae bacterium]|nr:transcriptional repressor [Oscillospiraceae bacterium]
MMTQKQMAELLCEQGIRPTTQRLAVYDYLYRHRTHPSADTVYEALVKKHPTFSKTTVYNSLHALVEAGLVLELAMDTGERHYDADTALHGHFHCRYCGGIADFSLDERLVSQLIPVGFQRKGRGSTSAASVPIASK